MKTVVELLCGGCNVGQREALWGRAVCSSQASKALKSTPAAALVACYQLQSSF